MGNQATQYENKKGKSVETFLLKYLPQFNYKLILNEAILYKTVLCTLEEGPVVCKFHFFKGEEERFKILEQDINKIRSTFNLYKHPNILVYEKVLNFQKKALMGVRQFVCHNLKEKLHRIPKLSIMEKKWLVFQLLCSVSQVHSEKLVHGDIKPDNIVLTSYNWLFLTDHMPYKPAYMKEDDLKLYNMFFGELDNNLRCYLAPERFKQDWDDSLKDTKLLEPQMDIFSCGCVIAEICMDGHPLFDLAHLQNYRKGLYSPEQDLLKKIKDKRVVDLILSMIDREPSNRLSINEYIQRWNIQVFPRSFSQIYYQIGSAFLRPQFLFSDQKISLIRKYVDSIWFACFGDNSDRNNQNKFDLPVVSEQFKEPIEPVIFERIREDLIKQFEAFLIPSSELFVFLSPQQLEIEITQQEGDQEQTKYKPTQDDKESIIVIIHWIGTFLHSCYFPQSRLCALEILQKLAEHSSIEIRLQFILPYVLQHLEDENSKVKGKAIEVCVLMFKDILEKNYVTTLTATDYKVFDNYILPAFLKMKNESQKDQYVQHVFVKYLPLFAQIGHRFLEISIGSRFQKRQQSKNQASRNQTLSFLLQQQIDENSKDDEDEQEAIFTHNENLLQASHFYIPRATIVIRDDQNIEKQQEHQDALEVFVNYDQEYDKLRRIIQSIINDILSETDSTLQRVLLQNIGDLSLFFGRKDTIDNLIPLSNSCFNKKDFMLRMECLKGIPYLGLRVGQQTLTKYLLITCTQLLYDSQELVVFEMIKSLTKLLQFKLLSKADSLDNLDKLLPFLLHPNTWIRDQAMQYVKFLSDPENGLMHKAEVYCLIRPKLKKYLQKGQKIFEIYGNDLNQQKLRPCLSREVYDRNIKTSKEVFNKFDILDSELSENDRLAKAILQEVLLYAKQYHQSFKRDKQQKEQENEYNDEFKRQKEKIKKYRVLQSQVIQQLAGVQFQLGSFQKKNISQIQEDFKDNDDLSRELQIEKQNQEQQQDFDSSQYGDIFYYETLKVGNQDIERTNYGLNKRVLNNSVPFTYELDMILQALCIIPEDQELTQIQYKNMHLFTSLLSQGLPVNTNIILEQSSEQPQSIPQFGNNAKTVSVPISSTSSAFYTLGSHHYKFNNWRPSGRLITTLFEHKNPVNSLAISDDSQYFITGSKQDGIFKVWVTSDIEKDVTSHSILSVDHKRQINGITTLFNSNSFALACSQGRVDIFSTSRLEQEGKRDLTITKNNSTSSSERQSIFLQNGLNNDFNYTSLVRSIEKKDEGDVNLINNMLLPISHQHILAYVTQRGSVYLSDLRARQDIAAQHELVGCQRGIPTCMTIGQDPYQLYFGTIGGYIAIYDVRYNVVSSFYKHYSRAPITSIASFHPANISKLNINKSDYFSPLALISSGSSNYEVSLVNLQTCDVEVLLTVDDTKIKENIGASIPTIPTYTQEKFIDQTGVVPRKFETSQSLFRRYLQSNRSSQHFSSLQSLQSAQYLKNMDEEWLKHSKNRYMLLKTAYESQNSCRKILVPRKYNNLLHNPETVNYAITGGNDQKIRYWDFQNLSKKSYYINTPNDDECQYLSESLGDTFVVQEKVNQFKQFPQLNSNLVQKQFDQNMNATNMTLANNSTYYGILGGLMQNQNQMNTDVIQGRSSSFQVDSLNDQTVIHNFNGLAEWQHFNGLSMNQGCGVVSQADSSSGSQEYMYRDSQSVSHQDCILDMGLLELMSQEPILITCGRDSLIKLWR